LTKVTYDVIMLLMKEISKPLKPAPEYALLRKFIDDKTRSYKEPQRTGTPRGEPIGFPRTKYLASLYLLTSLSLKEISEGLKISYGVLRKWRTEKGFKDLIAKNTAEFALSWMEHLRYRARENRALWESFLKRPHHEIAENEPHLLGYEEYVDAGSYSPAVNYLIGNLLLDKISSTEDEDLRLEILNVISAMDIYSGRTESDELRKKREEVKNILLRELLSRIEKTLLKPRITKRERAEALSAVAVMKKRYN
jgi:hypothetical protein